MEYFKKNIWKNFRYKVTIPYLILSVQFVPRNQSIGLCQIEEFILYIFYLINKLSQWLDLVIRFTFKQCLGGYPCSFLEIADILILLNSYTSTKGQLGENLILNLVGVLMNSLIYRTGGSNQQSSIFDHPACFGDFLQ